MPTKIKYTFPEVILILLFLSGTSFSQTYTFTPAGATGRYGPTQVQVSATYSNTNLNGQVTATAGIQYWIVPSNGIYRITAFGAKGGNGIGATTAAPGARVQGDFTLTAGQIIKIIAGQVGAQGDGPGGGGGSFVTTIANSPLVIAGGSGGSARAWQHFFGMANSAGNSGTSGMPGSHGQNSVTTSAGGIGGNGGGTSTSYTSANGSGGGGYSGNGINGNPATGGLSFLNGAIGGAGASSTTGIGGDGGFGGGGGGEWTDNTGAGGGGGYSGGGGGTWYGCGGGGGSFNSGANPVNTSSVNLGNGYVLITKITGINIIQTAPISCNGQLTAALTASAFGGTAPYTYTWSSALGNGSVVTGVGPGTYTCSSTDANFEVYTNTFVVTQPPLLTASSSQTNITCFNYNNGKITASASGGTAPYNYTWTPGFVLTPSVTNLAPGVYTCTVRDANSCVTSLTAAIVQPPPVSIFAFATNPVVCSGGTCALVASNALTYTWTGGISNGIPFNPTTSATYTVNGQDAAGCFGTAQITLTVNPSPTLSISGTNSVCAGIPVTLSVSGSPTYTWSTTETISSITVTPLSTTAYTVTGTGVNGCQSVAIKTISVVTVPLMVANSSTPAVCSGNSVTLFGSGATTYTWSGGISNNVSFTPTATDSYTVTGTNICGTNTAAITVTVHALPPVTANSNSAAICLGNSVILNGGGASTYTWTGGVTNNNPFSPANTNTYTVTGTDVNGCKNTAVKIVTVHPLPVVTANASNSVICAGLTVVLSGVGASTYTWTGGITDNVAFSPASTATYVVTGTDANGCQNTASKSVTVVNLPVVTANASTVSVCSGGSVTLFGSGAVSYAWSGGVTNNTPFVPSATTTYTVAGSNSCGTTSNVITVTVHTLPSVVANTSNSSVCSGDPLTLFGTGATTYTWTGGVTNNASFVPALSGNYTVTGTDNNGCRNTATQSITVNALPPVIALANNSVLCFGDLLLLSGGGANTYTWSNGIINNVPFTPTITTTYTVTGTGANGCKNTAQKTVTVYVLPIITISTTHTAICMGGTVALTGMGADTYTWSSGMANGSAISPGNTASFSVIGTSTLTGCTNVAGQLIVVHPLPPVVATASASATICNGDAVTLNGAGANTYTWTGGITNGLAFYPTVTTTYIAAGTNTLTGCTNTVALIVTVHPKPVVTAAATSTSGCKGYTTTLTGAGADTYVWTNGAVNGFAFSPTITTSYMVTGTHTLTGCTNTAVQTVSVNNLPAVSISPSSGTICMGETAVLTASGALIYIWDNNDVASAISVTPAASTSYTVYGTDANGCKNSAVALVDVSECTGIVSHSIGNESRLSIYPNPNNGQFTIYFETAMEIDVVNELGQTVKHVSLNGDDGRLNLQLDKGIYFVIGKQEGKVMVQKIIVTE